jgi:hypothetical protein
MAELVANLKSTIIIHLIFHIKEKHWMDFTATKVSWNIYKKMDIHIGKSTKSER